MRMISVALLDQNGALAQPTRYQQRSTSIINLSEVDISPPAATTSPLAAAISHPAAVGITFKFWFRLPLQGFIRLMTTSSFSVELCLFEWRIPVSQMGLSDRFSFSIILSDISWRDGSNRARQNQFHQWA